MRFVDICDRRAQRRHTFVSQRTRFIEHRRDLFARSLPFLCADAQIKAAVSRAIWPPLAFNVQCDDAPAVIERDAIDEWNQRRLNLLSTNPHEVVLHSLRIVYPLY